MRIARKWVCFLRFNKLAILTSNYMSSKDSSLSSDNSAICDQGTDTSLGAQDFSVASPTEALSPIEDHEDLSIIEHEGRSFYLIGTAHISQYSVDLTQRVIEELKPDCVAVELCESRFKSLKNPDSWLNTDIVKVIRSGRGFVLLTQLILASFQKRLGAKLNIKPGAEMMKAIEIAEANNADIALVDREVRITLKRAWRGLSIWGAARMGWSPCE